MENCKLTIALCHRLLRKAINVNDTFIVITAKPGPLKPIIYHKAVGAFEASECRAIITGTADRIHDAQTFYSSSARKDTWYRRTRIGGTSPSWTLADGSSWTLRSCIRSNGDRADHDFGEGDFAPVIEASHFACLPSDLKDAPRIPRGVCKVLDRWTGRSCKALTCDALRSALRWLAKQTWR